MQQNKVLYFQLREEKTHQFTSFKSARKEHANPRDSILTKERILQQFAMLCGMYQSFQKCLEKEKSILMHLVTEN